MKNYLFAFTFIMIVSCNNDKFRSDKIKNVSIKKSEKSGLDLSNKIIGLWTHEDSTNPQFEITKRSIIYLDLGEEYKYIISQDSINIFYPDYIFKGKIEITEDKLILSDLSGNRIKYIRK